MGIVTDKEDIKIIVELMRLHTSTLQQQMTLSAGGLALFFSFISKSNADPSMSFFGAVVILCWTASLADAVQAQRMLTEMFSYVRQIFRSEVARDEIMDATRDLMKDQGRLMSELNEARKNVGLLDSPHPDAIIGQMEERSTRMEEEMRPLDGEMEQIKKGIDHVKHLQTAVNERTHHSERMLLLGFLALAMSYLTSLTVSLLGKVFLN